MTTAYSCSEITRSFTLYTEKFCLQALQTLPTTTNDRPSAASSTAKHLNHVLWGINFVDKRPAVFISEPGRTQFTQSVCSGTNFAPSLLMETCFPFTLHVFSPGERALLAALCFLWANSFSTRQCWNAKLLNTKQKKKTGSSKLKKEQLKFLCGIGKTFSSSQKWKDFEFVLPVFGEFSAFCVVDIHLCKWRTLLSQH